MRLSLIPSITGRTVSTVWLRLTMVTINKYFPSNLDLFSKCLFVFRVGVYNRPPTTGSVIPMSDPVPAVSQFNRFEYGPSFQLTTLLSNGADLIPPQRVTDLTIISYDSSTRKVSLGWTASKDDWGSGDVGSCSICFFIYFQSANTLLYNWSIQLRITDCYGLSVQSKTRRIILLALWKEQLI